MPHRRATDEEGQAWECDTDCVEIAKVRTRLNIYFAGAGLLLGTLLTLNGLIFLNVTSMSARFERINAQYEATQKRLDDQGKVIDRMLEREYIPYNNGTSK